MRLLWFMCVAFMFPGAPAPMGILYPYGPDAGDTQFSLLDDGEFRRPLASTITVLNTRFSVIYMNTNGIISFGAYFNPHTPDPATRFPRNVRGVLAPFWVDWSFVDNTGAFQYFREVTSGPELSRATNDVRSGLAVHSVISSFSATSVIVMTYANATYWAGNEKTARNTVQVVIAAGAPRTTYALFQYGQVGWFSLGPYALVAFGGRNVPGRFSFLHVNSSTVDIGQVESTSNVNIDGRLLLQINAIYPTDECIYGVAVADEYCLCYDGYTGNQCDVEINECAIESCNERGVCYDYIDAFVCDCNGNFTGERCQVKVNSCVDDPCEHGACVDTETDYRCDCHDGYVGRLCELEVDECLSCPCHFGNCRDHIGRYTCDCHLGYTGKECDIDINMCTGNPCDNEGHCKDSVPSFVCFCPPGFSGDDCEIDLDSCEDSRCVYGRCVDADNRYVCECDSGYKGPLCDEHVHECASSPCFNGLCFDGIDEFSCECFDGYTGTWCESDIQDCHSSPCAHDGFCVDVIPGYECLCQDGFTGAHCESNIDECQSDPCNNGTCLDGDNSYQCECDPGYSGRYCETEIVECEMYSCLHGSCVDGVGSFSCVCQDGYTGEFCDYDINECASGPCAHGFCQDGILGYTCLCFSGYTGHVCETEVNECDSNPCLVGGLCHNAIDAFVCDCPDGISGTQCEVDLRSPVGAWSQWGSWTDCSKSCDNGLQTRYRQCLQEPCNHSNNKVQLCSKFPCQGDPLEDNSGGVLLETFKSEYEVAENEGMLKEAIAGTLNDFCQGHRDLCCSLVGVTKPRRSLAFSVFSRETILIASGYPMTTDNHRIRIKLLVRTRAGDMRASCMGDYHSDPATANNESLIYVPLEILQTALSENVDNLNQAICCWSVIYIEPKRKIRDILLGTLIPAGAVLLAVLVACACYPGTSISRWREDRSSRAEVTRRSLWPTGFHPRYFAKRPMLAFENYTRQRPY